MMMKTSELSGAALDWAVAECEGVSSEEFLTLLDANEDSGFWTYRYSTNWAQGGPIMEREKIAPSFCEVPGTLGGDCWIATYPTWPEVADRVWSEGPTPLIAIMRCYAANKLGEDVEIPIELYNG